MRRRDEGAVKRVTAEREEASRGGGRASEKAGRRGGGGRERWKVHRPVINNLFRRHPHQHDRVTARAHMLDSIRRAAHYSTYYTYPQTCLRKRLLPRALFTFRATFAPLRRGFCPPLFISILPERRRGGRMTRRIRRLRLIRPPRSDSPLPIVRPPRRSRSLCRMKDKLNVETAANVVTQYCNTIKHNTTYRILVSLFLNKMDLILTNSVATTIQNVQQRLCKF